MKIRKPKQTADEFYDKLYNQDTSVEDLQRQVNTHSLVQSFKKTDLDLKDKEDFLRLRLSWGKALYWILGGMLIYNATIVCLIGTNAISFQSDTVAGIVVGQNFVEVIGLVTIVLRALFPSKPSK